MAIDCNSLSSSPLQQGSKGEKVTELQRGLKKLGYYVTYNGRNLVVDGSYGTYTAWAVRQFQKATGHSQDGVFGPKTCPDFNKKLDIYDKASVFDCPNTNISRAKGSKGEKVKLLQTALTLLGYPCGDIDGVYGDLTHNAVVSYQRAKGLKQDGIFGPQTCRSLANAYGTKLVSDAEAEAQKKASNTTPAKTTTTSTTSPATQTVVKDPLEIDKTKNVYSVSEANFHIQGLHLIASKITPSTPFSNGNWSHIELMNGKFKSYMTHPKQLEYSVECYLQRQDFAKLLPELEKLGSQVCKVANEDIVGGYYTVNVTWDYNKTKYRKVTFKLIKYEG